MLTLYASELSGEQEEIYILICCNLGISLSSGRKLTTNMLTLYASELSGRAGGDSNILIFGQEIDNNKHANLYATRRDASCVRGSMLTCKHLVENIVCAAEEVEKLMATIKDNATTSMASYIKCTNNIKFACLLLPHFLAWPD
ncbi:hypothetical protein J6590_028276 [Homalodisca vitripennis]|nr:hypothetical protein J6590_028276 [Homalodisca vitripennis]